MRLPVSQYIQYQKVGCLVTEKWEEFGRWQLWRNIK